MRGSAKTVVEMVGWVADLSDSEAMETREHLHSYLRFINYVSVSIRKV
jgi:hypothetical protein